MQNSHAALFPLCMLRRHTVRTLCSHSGELAACCCTAAQQKESTYTACFIEKVEGAKQLIWVPEDGKDIQS